MSEPPRHRSTRRVLLVDDDRFEASSLRSVLEDQSLFVLGPYEDGAAALDALRTERIDAAIVAVHLSGIVIDALTQQGIPCLVLIHPPAPSLPVEEPFLARPFAGYQVAEWANQMVAQRS